MNLAVARTQEWGSCIRAQPTPVDAGAFRARREAAAVALATSGLPHCKEDLTRQPWHWLGPLRIPAVQGNGGSGS